MHFRNWCLTFWWSSTCSALAFNLQRGSETTNSSSRLITQYIAPLPSKPLKWWIGMPQAPASSLSSKVELSNIALRCSEREFGYPNENSCRDVLRLMPDGDETLTFGSRIPGAKVDVVLPYRYMSRKSRSRCLGGSSSLQAYNNRYFLTPSLGVYI